MPVNAIGSPQGKPRLGPYSRAIDRGTLGWAIDGRSREGRFLRAYEATLTKHVGGKPSRVQGEMIRRCARLALHLELMDEKTLRTGEMSAEGGRDYLSWHRALMASLGRLGDAASAPATPALSLREHLAAHAAAKAAQAATQAPAPAAAS